MSVHDLWAGSRTGAGRRWEVRWREAGRQCKRRFDTKVAAETFEARRRLEPVTQALNAGRTLTVDQLMATWFSTKARLPGLKTQDVYRTDVREVLLTFAGQYAVTISPTDVRVWVARDRGQSLRERSLRALRQAYQLAIADGLLRSDPTAGVPRPRPAKPPMRMLSWVELRRLAGDDPLVWVLGTVGLRIGEAAGLQVADVRGGRLHVRRQVTIASTGLVVGAPKHGSDREVPVPRFVLDLLPVEGRGPGEWLFGNRSGGPMHTANWRRRTFAPAVERAGLAPLRPHDLRHTAASLAIAAGADVKAVQRMLGHASAVMTLDLYAGLFDAQLDSVAERMDQAQRAAAPRLRVV